MPKTISPKRYATPMLPSDAAGTVERVAIILRAEADRMEREVLRLNQRAMVTRAEAEAERWRSADMKIPRVVTPANAKAHVPGPGRSRKTPAKVEA
jgi:hypothetical protein